MTVFFEWLGRLLEARSESGEEDEETEEEDEEDEEDEEPI